MLNAKHHDKVTFFKFLFLHLLVKSLFLLSLCDFNGGFSTTIRPTHKVVTLNGVGTHPTSLRLLKLVYQFSTLNIVATPFWPSVGVKPNTPKVGTWSPPGLLNVQSSTTRPKTLRIEAFLVSLESS
jgi:hypothetical protein